MAQANRDRDKKDQLSEEELKKVNGGSGLSVGREVVIDDDNQYK
jgi:bacteriocin-like protein